MMTKRGKCFEYDLYLCTKKASHCNKSTMLVCCLSTEYAYVKGGSFRIYLFQQLHIHVYTIWTAFLLTCHPM